jgi:hypothetical protein
MVRVVAIRTPLSPITPAHVQRVNLLTVSLRFLQPRTQIKLDVHTPAGLGRPAGATCGNSESRPGGGVGIPTALKCFSLSKWFCKFPMRFF